MPGILWTSLRWSRFGTWIRPSHMAVLRMVAACKPLSDDGWEQGEACVNILLRSRVVLAVASGILIGVSVVQGQDTRIRSSVIADDREDQRIALVVGNSDYAIGSLANPLNDARAMSTALKDLGFDVIELANASRREMFAGATEFGDRLGEDGVGVFYYAGHGLQVDGTNYLIPINAEIGTEADVEVEAVPVNRILREMDRRGQGLNIVILDACRNNPYARGWRSVGGGGLAKQDAPTGTLIAYATAPGMTAADGDGVNGTYTEELLRYMREPGLEVMSMFRNVREAVYARTGGVQVPWESSSIMGSFSFAPGGDQPNPVANLRTEPVSDPETNPSIAELNPGVTSVDRAFRERAVLAAFFEATGGMRWSDPNWLTDNPLETWVGITTDPEGFVTAIDLSGRGLRGSIVGDIGLLTGLRELNLHDNELTGPIPKEIGDLKELIALDLSNNALNGSLPERLRDMVALESFRISHNRLTGPIPTGIGSLAALMDLDLSWNQLEGRIPGNLGELRRLRGLNLGVNKLSGPIPAQFGRLSSLVTLDLTANELTGPIPPQISNLASLQSLQLGNNKLTGVIPGWLRQLTNLKSLSLLDNGFRGPIPLGLEELSVLASLDLSRNELTGPIPSQLGKLESLEELALEDNHLAGRIPAELGQLRRLRILSVGQNDLSGLIPRELGNLQALERLSMPENRLTGPIPLAFGGLARLTSLNLGGNSLEGPIHDGLASLRELTMLALDRNDLTGRVPDWLGDFRAITRVSLAQNQLSGSVPPELGNLSSLLLLDLGDNLLSGPIPGELGDLASATDIDLHDNRLSGPIPAALLRLTSLVSLDVSGNTATGLCVPEALLTWYASIPFVGGDRERPSRCPEGFDDEPLG